ncbi:MAG: L,D-transpeptidase family protein [bacterium]|nr:L,D-transpeptidase family protein [bacterium]
MKTSPFNETEGKDTEAAIEVKRTDLEKAVESEATKEEATNQETAEASKENASDQKMPEKAAPDKEASDQEVPEKVAQDEKASDQEMPEKAMQDEKASDQEMPEKTASDKEVSDQKMPEKAVSDKETSDQEMPEKAASDKEASEQGSSKEETAAQETSKEEAATQDALEKQEDGSGKGKRKAPKIIAAVIAVLLVLTAAGYLGTAFFYQSRFLPNTVINGEACGNLEASEVVLLIDAQLEDYSLTVTGRDYATCEPDTLLGVIEAEDVALAYVDTLGAVEDVLTQQNMFLWPQAYFGKQTASYSIVQGVTFDEELLKNVVSGWDSCRVKNMVKPADAYISEYQDEINGYEIIPETAGTVLNMDAVFEYVADCLYAHEESLDLEEMQCYAEASRKSTDENLRETVETVNKWLGTKIVYDWNENEVVLDVETLKDWISIDGDEATLDEEAVEKFVKAQAKQYDTYGKRKNFVTALGITLKLQSPNYGWKTDTAAETEELISLIRQGSEETREPVYSVKASQKGANDVGNSYIEADLTHQHLYVHEKGEIVLETDFVSGKMNSTPGCVTPEGIFGLTYKTLNAVLRGADYETPVSYWMPFYGNYGMHDATWRTNFGGTIYKEHGSHGCINLPVDAAAAIYGYVHTGSPVICYYYEVDPLETPAETQTLTEEELLNQEEPSLSQQAEQSQQTQ